MPDSPPPTPVEEKTCRICLDGADPELGRLIHPCLCKGSISHVHVKCLQRWRLSSPTGKAFFECPQCKYRYNMSRARASGLAHNPVILGVGTAVLFTALVMTSSFVTTFFFRALDTQHASSSSWFSIYPYEYYFVSDFVNRLLGIFRDQEDRLLYSANHNSSLGFLRRFMFRFIQGLPLLSSISIVATPLAMPLQMLTRWRGFRRNRDTADFATVLMIGVLLYGVAKTLTKVYEFTQQLAQRILLRAEDAVLEV